MTERPPRRTSGATRVARSPLAALSATLAGFLVVLALLTARVVKGTDPGLRGTSQAQVISGHGRTIVRTTASGRVIRETTGAAPEASGREAAALTTRTSGGSGAIDD
jgi:hypothetical protein